MKWLQNAYTRRFNTRHKEWGRLFGDRYKSIVTEGRKGEYYASLADGNLQMKSAANVSQILRRVKTDHCVSSYVD